MARQVTQIARTAWTKAQAMAALVLCIGTAMVLPISLAVAGLPTV